MDEGEACMLRTKTLWSTQAFQELLRRLLLRFTCLDPFLEGGGGDADGATKMNGWQSCGGDELVDLGTAESQALSDLGDGQQQGL